ncbi:MAG: ATP-binding cassette domain-containing protein [Treponema sp.]|nr:ATP-binding cassette domain-containing protein [Treponema sp.]
MALLEMRNIIYPNDADPTGEHPVLNNINLSIEEGTITAFLGKPGGGKSTALKVLAGLLIPSSGEILFAGKDIHKMSSRETLFMRKKSAFMFQDSALWANQDIFHNLELPLQVHYPQMSAKERAEKIAEMMSLVGYEKPGTLRPASLSIGEQKRIGFARALIHDPEVLFLDEPTESIDIKTIRLFNSIIKKFLAQGRTLIYVSHDKDFIKRFNGDKYFFDQGMIKKHLTKDEDYTEESYEI